MKLNIILYSVVLAVLGASLAHADGDSGQSGRNGAVYTMDNSPSGNNVLLFDRNPDGTIVPTGSQSTGGFGTGAGLGSQGAVLLTSDGQWLFVCNARSDDISIFAVNKHGLELRSKTGSGGRMPISLTLNGNLLYVLNGGGSVGAQDNITGFRFDHGQLISLPNSTRTLSADNTGPAQVAFTSDGDVLVVTEKNTSIIDTFALGDHGLANEHKLFASPAQTPFGFAPGHHNRIFVSNAAESSLSSYEVSEDGDVEVISNAMPNHQAAACWAVLTDNNRFAYTANAASGSISGFAVDHQGVLQLLNPDGRTGVTGDGSHPIDMALSNDDRFLYSLDSGNGMIAVFAVRSTGALESLSRVGGLPAAVSGLAAH
jgi:6-phosphogluconolactonase (cycloisomerase 2 family)